MEEAIHDEDASFAVCTRLGLSCAFSDGGWPDSVWEQWLEERKWAKENQFLRLGEDCPSNTRGHNLFDFETPQYHLLTLAKEGIEVVTQSMEHLEDKQRALLRDSIAIVNVDGSVGDECEPLTMTLKARMYALGAPRSIEVRHEYHRREGWDAREYQERVSWRLNHPSECGRRFMPSYTRDENGWHTMFTASLEYSSRPSSATAAAGAAARGGRGGARGRGRGRGKARNKRARVEELAETAGDTETGTDSVVEGGDDEPQLSGLAAADGDSSGGTAPAAAAAGPAEDSGTLFGPNRQANRRTGGVGVGGAGTRSYIMKQKWVMTGEDLEAIHEHLLAGTDLEDQVGGHELLELLLASVGISQGKVGEVEVGKVVYGKGFLEFYTNKTAQASGLEGSRSGAGSQANSGNESEGEAEPRTAHQQQQQGSDERLRQKRLSEETPETYSKRARYDSGDGEVHSSMMMGGGAGGPGGVGVGMGMGMGMAVSSMGMMAHSTVGGGHYYGTSVVGAGPMQLHMMQSRLSPEPPAALAYPGYGGAYVGSSIGPGGGLMGGSLAGSRAPTPDASLGSWGVARAGPAGSVGSVQAAMGGVGGEPERTSSRRKRNRGNNGAAAGRRPAPPGAGLPPLGPAPHQLRHSTEVEAS